jgi:hypothetical protein
MLGKMSKDVDKIEPQHAYVKSDVLFRSIVGYLLKQLEFE